MDDILLGQQHSSPLTSEPVNHIIIVFAIGGAVETAPAAVVAGNTSGDVSSSP